MIVIVYHTSGGLKSFLSDREVDREAGSRIIIPKDKFLLWIEKQFGEG